MTIKSNQSINQSSWCSLIHAEPPSVCVIRRPRRWTTFAKRVLPQGCCERGILATAGPRLETSTRSCSGDERVDCVSLFFPTRSSNRLFFLTLSLFLLPTASWSHPAEPPPAPTEVFHEAQTWEQILQMKKRKVPGNNNNNMGGLSGKMCVLSRIPPTHQAVMCSRAEKKFADEFLFMFVMRPL